ncbi:MAG: cell division/cell wall cluster transcriptional repressor MraZ [Acidiphilium sp. 37-64-53]|uniref:division/cell wall cluster transcriptional repressor MraZ n=1 Tax=Acidiphilium TaxID=522 RepID=UPI000BC9DC00|nr:MULTISPECIES: division/cell wall cluster transcriptional repressor MraZ [Acidiphilium]OYW04230.1 MAG: cell division/cell wall cluster transcriptional repressor MraZ [Acidiphilium sp. 37-64-53]OZB31161.1 MAG: cell division/cell wall cluster transcriptional repressor MraZ [Acidiphilium sp. 34-64-41]HQT83484.1 division/cell wall cluster transcriptional repressor MraZ [Acidiphilium rubrum]
MSQFLGTHQNRLDAKGRVSIPAPFRAKLRGDAEPIRLIFRPSHKYACIEAWPEPMFKTLAAKLDHLQIFSDQHDDLAELIYGDAYKLDADKEGRVLLPEKLVRHAGLTDSVVFKGVGSTFQIWEPEAAGRRSAAVREPERAASMTLPSGVLV